MTRILITGNLGYVGPGVVRQLRQSQPAAELWGLDTGYFAHCLTAAQRSPEHGLTGQMYVDVRDVRAEHLVNFDAVIHLAAISNDPMGNKFEAVTMDVNQSASEKLASLAKAAGVKKFVFASSCSVYGTTTAAECDESVKTNPLTAYARSKVGLEDHLRTLASADFTATCLRFATACGMSPRLRLDLVLNDFVAGALASGKIDILSDGQPWRPLIHVADMARALDWATQRPAESGGDFLTINVGRDDWNYRVADLADAVAREIPGTKVSINADAPADKRSYRVSFRRFAELARGFTPTWDLSATVRDLRDGLQAMHFADSDFRTSTLMRLRVLAGFRDRAELDEQLRWRNE